MVLNILGHRTLQFLAAHLQVSQHPAVRTARAWRILLRYPFCRVPFLLPSALGLCAGGALPARAAPLLQAPVYVPRLGSQFRWTLPPCSYMVFLFILLLRILEVPPLCPRAPLQGGRELDMRSGSRRTNLAVSGLTHPLSDFFGKVGKRSQVLPTSALHLD